MGRLIAELRRRNVFRVAGVYAVVAWLLVQVVVAIKTPLGLPGWTDTFFIVLLGVGFPMALVFAWAFEMTPDGMKLTANVPEGESIAPKTGRKLDLVIIGGLALVAAMIVADRLMPEKPAVEQNSATGDAGALSGASIAVLPFADMSPEGDQGYFSDGIAEEVLNVLAQIPDLKVAGRTSSFSFKGKNEDLRAIGAALGVANVLEGSVRKQGDKVRITAQLVKAADGFHLWSDTYDRDLKDVFAIQDEISRAIADALSVKMGARAAPAGGPSSATAHDLYLRARQSLAMRTEQAIADSAVLFQAATILDPAFADAWSGRARALSLLSTYSGETTQQADWSREAIAAAGRAIELAPDNAEAYSARGYAYGALLWDWKTAKENIDKSVELAPNDAEIANFAGDYYRIVADAENAFRWEAKAVELDPLFYVNERDLGITTIAFGRCADAIPHMERSVELGGGMVDDVWLLALAQICAGELDAARQTIARLKTLKPAAFFTVAELEMRLALKEGRAGGATAAQDGLQNAIEAGTPNAGALAVLLAERGDDAGAAHWFEESYRRREYILIQPDVFKLPEQWGDHPLIAAALDKPELAALFEIRRKNLAEAAREPAP